MKVDELMADIWAESTRKKRMEKRDDRLLTKEERMRYDRKRTRKNRRPRTSI